MCVMMEGVMRTDSMIIGSWFDAYNSPGYQWPTNWENLSDGMQITSFYRLGLSDNNSNYIIAGAQREFYFFIIIIITGLILLVEMVWSVLFIRINLV